MKSEILKRISNLEKTYNSEPTMVILCSPSGERIKIDAKDWDKYEKDYPYFERIAEGGSEKGAIKAMYKALDGTLLHALMDGGEMTEEEARQRIQEMKQPKKDY